MKGQPVPTPVRELIIKVDHLAKEFSLYPNTIRKWLQKLNQLDGGLDGGNDANNSNNSNNNTIKNRNRSDALLISKLQREKQELLEIIGELTVLTKQSKKNLVSHCIKKLPHISRKRICEIFNFNRSISYYNSKKLNGDNMWLNKIVEVLKLNPDYGICRLYLHFKLNKEIISESKIRRICRSNGITAKTKPSKPPRRDKQLADSGIPNLIKELEKQLKEEKDSSKQNLKEDSNPNPLQTPNYVWSGDFSYFRINGIWYYLATVIDNYTKEILGFSLSSRHNTALIKNALNMALAKNRIPNIFHSDQGSEYRSEEYQSLLQEKQIRQSNSNKSSPWENGIQESFYGKFKDELKLYRLSYCQNYMEAYNLIVAQIDYYNNRRIHTTIKNIPSKFYAEYMGI